MSRFTYQATIRHDGLGKYRVIRGAERHIVEAAAYAQERAWNEQYAKKVASEERRRERQHRKQQLEDNLNEAEERTREADKNIQDLRCLLSSTLRVNDAVRWDSLKQFDVFSEPEPHPRQYHPLPIEPQADEAKYQPQLGLIDKLWRAGAQKKNDAVRALFEADHARWRERVATVEAVNRDIYAANVSEWEEWQQRSKTYEQERQKHNDAVDRRHADYRSKNPEAITDYCNLVLSQSNYPDCLPQAFECDYVANTRTLVVDYQLPSPADLPRTTQVKYVRSKNELVETEMPKKQFEQFYEQVVCQIALRTLHELFESDIVNAIEMIVFNGSVRATNLGTGHVENRCILSLAVDRPTFLPVNLSNVDARVCFNSLGGLAEGKLNELNAVVPLGLVNAEDPGKQISDCSTSAYAEWQELVKSLSQPTDLRLVRVSRLAAILGFPKQQKYSPALSRYLASVVRARGFAVEPDSSLHGLAYVATDQVAVFRPIDTNVSDTHLGALALLQWCMRIAAADDEVTEKEMDVIREFIAANVQQTPHERQRLHFFEKVLCRQPDLAERSLVDLENRLSIEHRRSLAQVLVCIAGADGEISSPEWIALDRAMKCLHLPPSTLEDILRDLGAAFVEPTIQEAEPDEPGERLPNAATERAVQKPSSAAGPVHFESSFIPPVYADGTATSSMPVGPVPSALPPSPQRSAPTFTLDMRRVAAISRETAEVVSILSAVMQESEQEVKAHAVPQPAISFEPNIEKAKIEVPTWLRSLDSKYQSVASRLIVQPQWTKSEFQQLAAEFKLMPLGVFDAVNEWSDEHLGDFILEGEDPIIVNIGLIPK